MLDRAVRWANGARWELADTPTFGTLGPHLTLARVRLAESRALGEPSLAEPILPLVERLVAVTAVTEHRYALLELLVVQALLLDWVDRPVIATQTFNEALDLAAPASIRRLILDFGPSVRPLLQRSLRHNPAFVTDLLNRFDQAEHPAESEKALVASNLTDREREVLQAIVAGLSNKEIESSLFISKNTVRTHIKNLYSKLAVTSRTQAVAVAREKGLL